MRLPPLHIQLFNFSKAVIKHAIDGLENVNKKTFNNRVEVCSTCELREDKRCSECGCFIDWKALWASEDCPKEKWQ